MIEENLNTEIPSEEGQNQLKNNLVPMNQKSKNSGYKGVIIVNGILLIGLIILYVLFFTNNKEERKIKMKEMPEKGISLSSVPAGPLSIAFVNTDTIIMNYQYAKDLENELQALRNNLEKSYTNQVTSLKSDVENYLKIGATLSLTEQKKREESFAQREKDIAKMQESMVVQIQQKQITENTKLINAIYAFIKEYNENNKKYTIILKKSFLESPVLYIDEHLDLTNEILEGLNKEYADVKGTSSKK